MTIVIIHTEFVYPPIPIRSYDWAAVTDDYEPGSPHGEGATEAEAIEDLLRQLREANCPACDGMGHQNGCEVCHNSGQFQFSYVVEV